MRRLPLLFWPGVPLPVLKEKLPAPPPTLRKAMDARFEYASNAAQAGVEAIGAQRA